MVNNDEIIRTMSVLYELALSTGQTLNYKENCEKFITKITRMKSLNYGSVWIKNKYLNKNETDLSLLFAKPLYFTPEKEKEDIKLYEKIKEEKIIYVQKEDELFDKIKSENIKGEGQYILIHIQELGFLKFYDKSNKEIFTNKDMQKMKKVFNKFGISLRGSLAYKNMKEKMKETIEKKKYYNSLTNLPNRLFFKENLEEILKDIKSKNLNNEVGVLRIEVERIKMIDNAFGHEKGDELIKNIAQRLSNLKGKYKFNNLELAHLGGEDFVYFFEYKDKEILEEFITEVILTLEKYFKIDNEKITINFKIGISLFPKDGQKSIELLEKAENAMYNHNKSSKKKYTFHSDDLDKKEDIKKEMIITNKIKEGIENDEFEVYYQPQIDIKNGKVKGVEALVRWVQKDGEVKTPYHFISVAEKNCLIIDIDNIVITKACEQVKEWNEKYDLNLTLSVNVSAVHFQENEFFQKIKNLLEKIEFPPEKLKVEITENLLLKNIEEKKGILKKLRGLGINISVDDFGTGFSSLNYLTKLPINELKIDKSFIFDLNKRKENEIVAETIISLGKNLKTNVIAEGVEELKHLEFLQDKECNEAQGYLISKPLPAKKIEKLITAKEIDSIKDFFD